MSDCKNSNCHTHDHGQCHASGCSCSTCQSVCQSSCNKHHETDECCDMPQYLLSLADKAWEEVVKEKLKKQIEAKSGAHLDKLTELVARTNSSKWHNKLTAKKACGDYQSQLWNLFSSNGDNKK